MGKLRRSWRGAWPASGLAALLLLLLLSSFIPLLKSAWHSIRMQHSADPLKALPPVMLWAWERPENLEFIDPREVGVACLAGTATLLGDGFTVTPRLQSLRLPPKATVVAVVRVEDDRSLPPQLSDATVADLAARIAGLCAREGISAVQIDYDALESERKMYRRLLMELRRRLPARVKLSITALASWCLYDGWMAGLPVDEAVPMLFRMGAGAGEVRSALRAGRDFREPLCRNSTGISTDEPAPDLPGGRRVYVFSPRLWTAASVNGTLKDLRTWR